MFPSLRKWGRPKGGSSQTQKSSSQSTQGSQSAPSSPQQQPPLPPIGWSPSLGSANTAYPLQSGPGSSAPQRQQPQAGRGFGHPQEEFFPGGFLRVGTNIAPNATARSASPTSLTGSNSVASHPHPHPHPHPQSNGYAQQPPPVAQPNVEKDECYAWFLAVDQDGNGQLSPEELRSALLNDGGRSYLATRAFPHPSIISRHVVLKQNGEAPYEHLCTPLSESFQG